MKEMISRRSFLRVMGLGFGAAMLTACKTGTADSPADSPAASVPDPDTPVPFLRSSPASTAPRPASP